MTDRISEICSHIPRSGVFADVGCDHGFCTRYVVDHDLCDLAVISDVSAESLKKAEKLLAEEISGGKVLSVCTDGLKGFPVYPDCVLIAGMGGEEIVKILSEGGIPQNFVLQPMKNSEKVRAFLVGKGVTIAKDYTFEDGKFYDLIAGSNGGETEYSEWEIQFGRDNLLFPSLAFARKLRRTRDSLRNLLNGQALSPKSREELRDRLYAVEEVINAIEERV